MTDFFFPPALLPLPQFLKLLISRPAAVPSVTLEKQANEDTRVQTCGWERIAVWNSLSAVGFYKNCLYVTV